MKPAIVIAAATLLLINGAAQAEVYRQVDAQGNVTFSDEPSSGAEAIEVKPVTTITLPKLQDLELREQPEIQQQKPDSIYDSVQIISPQDKEAFNSGNGNVEFRIISSPLLRDGHKYEVTLDGQPVGQSATGTIMVQHMDRGTHQAGVNIINRDGIQVASGAGITFTIHRPSRLN
jgi:hypothetical protein